MSNFPLTGDYILYITSTMIVLFFCRRMKNAIRSCNNNNRLLCHHHETLPKKLTFKKSRYFDRNKYWFEEELSEIPSEASRSNTMDNEDGRNWRGPSKYSPPIQYPYLSTVEDNTEGIAAFVDLYFPPQTRTILDVGGGKSDAAKVWMSNKYPDIRVEIVDPFHRTFLHNANVQKFVYQSGGVDIVTSNSVLNVIPDYTKRIDHCIVVYDALKVGGLAYFKIWAGMWPIRGSEKCTVDNRGVFQANSWAHVFRNEVEYVFGNTNVFVDNNKNLIVAIKGSS